MEKKVSHIWDLDANELIPDPESWRGNIEGLAHLTRELQVTSRLLARGDEAKAQAIYHTIFESLLDVFEKDISNSDALKHLPEEIINKIDPIIKYDKNTGLEINHKLAHAEMYASDYNPARIFIEKCESLDDSKRIRYLNEINETIGTILSMACQKLPVDMRKVQEGNSSSSSTKESVDTDVSVSMSSRSEEAATKRKGKEAREETIREVERVVKGADAGKLAHDWMISAGYKAAHTYRTIKNVLTATLSADPFAILDIIADALKDAAVHYMHAMRGAAPMYGHHSHFVPLHQVLRSKNQGVKESNGLSR